MTARPVSWIRRWLPGWLAAGVCVSVAILCWFGYRAMIGWERSARLLADRRANQAADLLLTALSRDMRGVQHSVLSSPYWDAFLADPSADITTLVAGAFARYPYPESFFAWRGEPRPNGVLLFTRSDRKPCVAAGRGARGTTSAGRSRGDQREPVSGGDPARSADHADAGRSHREGRGAGAAVLGVRNADRRRAVSGDRAARLRRRVPREARGGVRLHRQSAVGAGALFSRADAPGRAHRGRSRSGRRRWSTIAGSRWSARRAGPRRT